MQPRPRRRGEQELGVGSKTTVDHSGHRIEDGKPPVVTGLAVGDEDAATHPVHPVTGQVTQVVGPTAEERQPQHDVLRPLLGRTDLARVGPLDEAIDQPVQLGRSQEGHLRGLVRRTLDRLDDVGGDHLLLDHVAEERRQGLHRLTGRRRRGRLDQEVPPLLDRRHGQRLHLQVAQVGADVVVGVDGVDTERGGFERRVALADGEPFVEPVRDGRPVDGRGDKEVLLGEHQCLVVELDALTAGVERLAVPLAGDLERNPPSTTGELVGLGSMHGQSPIGYQAFFSV